MAASVTHVFLQTFISAYRSNKPYVVVRASRPALQCLRIFHQYALVERYGILRDPKERRRFAPTVHPNLREKYLLVWMHRFAPSDPARSQQRWLVERQAGDQPSAKAPHQLEMVRRPSARSQQRITLRQMMGQVPNFGAVYLLETPLGILTTAEARQRRVGGRAIAVFWMLRRPTFPVPVSVGFRGEGKRIFRKSLPEIPPALLRRGA